ncbi:MFS transporter [Alphaproteobacteria bacterium LMG 31809]|uniref:MFS transporter n=2 Tax=Govanella unica TaxID=2975056 RepID=A0A9X3TWX7_9PROT|nr:MFS transporter [Govania unica]MDA5192907.1 MFS transporter [Govania unica]
MARPGSSCNLSTYLLVLMLLYMYLFAQAHWCQIESPKAPDNSRSCPVMHVNQMDTMSTPSYKYAHAILLLVVFVDLLGFGILGPLIPFYVERLGATTETITVIIALYSLTQFIAMPVWGYLSDRIGRRPVLAISMAGHALSYVIMAYADSLWMMAFARIVGGVTSANLATAYAYMADTTDNKNRAKGLGRISAAFGLGFVLGPVIGGFLAGGDSVESANFMLPAFVAAGLSVLSFAGILLFLPESRPAAKKGDGAQKRPGFLTMLKLALGRPLIAMITGLCFLVITFVAMRESILPLWGHYLHGLSPVDIGILLSVSGGTVTLFQLIAIGPLTARFGEVILVKTAIFFYAIGWTGLVLSDTLIQMSSALCFTAVATAMFQTCLQSLLSQQAAAHERGTIMAVYQSSSSLARFSGQAMAGTAYGQIGPNAPFTLGVVAMFPAMVLIYFIGNRIRGLLRTDTSEVRPQE